MTPSYPDFPRPTSPKMLVAPGASHAQLPSGGGRTATQRLLCEVNRLELKKETAPWAGLGSGTQ
eukprot:188315-Prymnesium_polylepis.2